MASVRSLAQNWKLKLLASALAVLLWIVVSAEQVTSNWIPVPLEVVVTDDDYVLEERPAGEVEVRFSGPGRELWDLVIRRPPLRLVVTDIADTTEVVNLEPRMVQIPNQLSVNALDVNPGQVTLEFTRVAARTLPVAVRTAEELPAGWVLSDTLRVEPREVRVSGPASRLGALDRVATRPLTLGPGDSVFSRTVAVDTSNLRGLEITPREVRVTGRVERVMERTLGAVPIDVGPGVHVLPATAEVVIRGPGSLVERVSPDEVRVVISIDSIPERIPVEGLPVPVRVEHPHRALRAEANPRTVRLYPFAPVPDTLESRTNGASFGAGPRPGR